MRMPLRFARGHHAGLVLTVAAIACGVALVCAVDLANRAVLRAFVEVIDNTAGRVALQVTAGEEAVFPEDVAAAVGEIAGVELALPVVLASAFLTDGGGEQLAVHGIDLTNDAAGSMYGFNAGSELDDPLMFVTQPDSIALTRAFAARRGITIGDRIDLMTPAGRRVFTIRGLLEPQGVARAYGGNVVIMDLFAAEAAFTRSGFINGVDVDVERGADLTRVADAIAQALPDGLAVRTPLQRQADLHKVMQSLHVALRAMALFGLAVAFLITFNRLSGLYERRAWQLGVLRAVGVQRRVVWTELMKESLLLGAAGVCLGVPLGIALGRLVLPVIATTTALTYKLVAPEAELTVDPSTVFRAAGLGIAAALLAAALPAWRLSQVSLAETMRSRGSEQPGGRWDLRPVWFVMIGGTALAVAIHFLSRSVASGLVATGLITIGIALAARPFVALMGGVVGATSRVFGGPVGWFAAHNLFHNPRRTTLTVATIGVGFGCVVWFWTMATSFQNSLIASLTAAVRADLIVSSSHVTSGYVEASVSEELMTDVAQVAGVATVVGSRVIDWPHEGRRIAIDAIDPIYFTRPDFGQWPLFGDRISDVWENVARGNAAVVSANLSLNAGAQVGETIVLQTPTGPISLRVGGVTAAFESPNGTILMSRDLYARLWQDRQINRVAVGAAPGVSVAAIRTAILRDLGRKYDLRILSSAELIDYYSHQVRRAFAPLRVLAVMVLLVTLFGVADTLAAGVLERTREIGVVRAVGVGGRSVSRMVVTEGMLLGALGIGLAVAGGMALAVLWIKGTMPFLLGWVLEFYAPYREVPMLLVLTSLVCGAAALIPAARAARFSPQAALRYE